MAHRSIKSSRTDFSRTLVWLVADGLECRVRQNSRVVIAGEQVAGKQTVAIVGCDLSCLRFQYPTIDIRGVILVKLPDIRKVVTR